MPYLDKYVGEWDLDTAKHLLHRTTLGPTKDSIIQSKEIGLEATIDNLFNLSQIGPPLKHEKDGTFGLDDPDVNYGEPWVEASIIPNVLSDTLKNRILESRKDSLAAWTIQQLLIQPKSILGKLWIFWHNHFVVAEIENPTRLYKYSNLIFENLLGNFKELTYKMTVDTAMLQYLSGATNTKDAPNENYARELLELFTLGKGELAGPGDYTTFTEKDVAQGAKILTGWTVPEDISVNPLNAVFNEQLHSTGSKQLSPRFGDITIPHAGADEYKVFIDAIFDRKECAQFITRKFFRYFVSPQIDQDVEDNMIIPLSQLLYEDEYDIKRMLKTLLSSSYLFSSIRCIIKSPIEIIADATAGQTFIPPSEISESYSHYSTIYRICQGLNQWIYYHPTVAGWKAYYQEPQYDKAWINTTILPKRKKSLRILIAGGKFIYINIEINIEPTYNPINIINQYENAAYIELLIKEIAEYSLVYAINDQQIAKIKSQVMQGLPDFEWTIEYNNYIDNPNNENLKNSLNSKLINLFSTIFSLPEYQIA